jgi:hypothetical protein
LMCFILLSLIMRTAFQARSFDILKKDLYKKEIETIDEMIERNFTLFTSDSTLSSYNLSEMFSG